MFYSVSEPCYLTLAIKLLVPELPHPDPSHLSPHLFALVILLISLARFFPRKVLIQFSYYILLTLLLL